LVVEHSYYHFTRVSCHRHIGKAGHFSIRDGDCGVYVESLGEAAEAGTANDSNFGMGDVVLL
jgi:hypothetical protein